MNTSCRMRARVAAYWTLIGACYPMVCPLHGDQACWPTLNMNGWMGAAFVCEERLHPTAWVGQQARHFGPPPLWAFRFHSQRRSPFHSRRRSPSLTHHHLHSVLEESAPRTQAKPEAASRDGMAAALTCIWRCESRFQAVDWLSTASTTTPWFLKVSFHRPHSPYDPPARILNATKESDLPTPQLVRQLRHLFREFFFCFWDSHAVLSPMAHTCRATCHAS